MSSLNSRKIMASVGDIGQVQGVIIMRWRNICQTHGVYPASECNTPCPQCGLMPEIIQFVGDNFRGCEHDSGNGYCEMRPFLGCDDSSTLDDGNGIACHRAL